MTQDDRSNTPSDTSGQSLNRVPQDSEELSRSHRREADARRYAEAAQPLLDELRGLGFDLRQIEELKILKQRHRDAESAIPILLRWIPKISYEPLKNDVIHTLVAIPKASSSGAAAVLMKEFEGADDPSGTGLRWSIADALTYVATDQVFDDIVRCVNDPRNSYSRQMLTLSLAKMKSCRQQAIDVLLGLLDDDEVVGHAVIALGKLCAMEAIPKIDELQSHPITWIRNEAKKAARRIRSSRA